MGTFKLPLLIYFTYYFLVLYLGPRLMRNRPPFSLKWVIIPYNLVMSLFNAYCFYRMLVGSRFGKDLISVHVSYQDPPEVAEENIRLTYLYCISKYVDMLDTLFFILRKKADQVTGLHVYHHTSNCRPRRRRLQHSNCPPSKKAFPLNNKSPKTMSCTRKYDLSNRVAIVTGSSSGIGAEIAYTFAVNGAQVVITGRNAGNLGKVAKRIEAAGGSAPLQVIGSLTDEGFPAQLIKATVDKFGGFDILVNCAGGASPNGAIDNPNLLAEYDNVMNLNVRTVVEMTVLAIPYLEKSKVGGNVLNISSIAGMKASPGLLAYNTSKAAVDMVTKTCALELGPRGIRVNSINPGPVASNFGQSMNMDPETFKEWQKNVFLKNSLIGKIGAVEDIANLAAFIVSDDGKNLVGSLVVSDTGFMLKS
ncbi:PREDICTED: uncharacterized oxidoreductase MT0954-like [Rhagoletis zephyria]|uniref:uncharacterized oxidoreductase MT0954-like n=1 Tax=Rhagoletis zephyria TaxID=28612 RepID=UPI00081121C0|nr:PREDICTED: uncharacterized oxidoreductase MT0954-like [Rhagoletis zephyria]